MAAREEGSMVKPSWERSDKGWVGGARGHGFAVAVGHPSLSHRHKERGGFKGITVEGKRFIGVVSRSL